MNVVNKKVSYRFRRVIGGIVHYAEVSLSVHPSSSPQPGKVFPATHISVHQTWVNAAIHGVQTAARDLGYCIGSTEIEAINGTIIDTHPDTIEVAAYSCMYELITGKKPPEPEFKNGEWYIPPFKKDIQ